MVNVVQSDTRRKEAVMPGGDRTGPNGLGPLSGRRMGDCVDMNSSGFRESGYDRGFGRGFRRGSGFGGGMGYGFGQGYGRMYPDNQPEVQENAVLKNEMRTLKDQLASLEKKLSDFKNES